MARTAKRPRADRKPARPDRLAPPEPTRELVVAGGPAITDRLPALPDPGQPEPALPVPVPELAAQEPEALPRRCAPELGASGLEQPELSTPQVAGSVGTLSRRPPDRAWLPRMARFAVWALPAYALAGLWFTARPVPDPMADPVAWADRVTSGGYLGFQLLAGLGSVLLGLVAVLALVVLLAPTGARWVAGAGLLLALVSGGLLAFRQGVAGLAAPALGEQVQAGNLAAAYAFQRAYAPGGWLSVDGPMPPAGWLLLATSVLVTMTWLVLAWAVHRSGRFGRLDAVLLAAAAPLLGLAGGMLPLLPPLGALLLLAAGIGIAWSGRAGGGVGRAAGAELPVCRS